MARRKLLDRFVRSLNKTASGSSYSLTLPIDIIRKWRWKNRQKLQLTIDEKQKRIIIEDWKGSMRRAAVVYSDQFQKRYRYSLSEPSGKNFAPEFTPDLTPQQMLKLGVFGGAYFIGVKNLQPTDLPASWFRGVKLSPDGEKHAELNHFGIRASQPLAEWKRKDWIYPEDPHGWFQWYCRYYLGRRIAREDERQIKRWKAIRRHVAQVKKNCRPGDMACRSKQRQALLHWAYDSRQL